MNREDIVDENVNRLVYTIADAANLVAIAVAAEREACAKVCEALVAQYEHSNFICAKAIRARGVE